MNRAVFSDRDNVLVEDLEGYIYEIEKFKLLDGVIEGLRLLNETDYKVIIITNQTGIGSGYYTKENYKKFTEHMLNIFRKNSIRIDEIYYCPHHPKGIIEKYSFERASIQYNKSAKYFIGFVSSITATTPENFKKEILELRWVNYNEAKQLLTFPEAREVLNQAFEYLKTEFS